jgi:hypothetical protein
MIKSRSNIKNAQGINNKVFMPCAFFIFPAAVPL